MKRRTVRVTPLGYIVLTIIILVMVVSIYFIVWSMGNTNGEQPQGNLNSNSVTVPTPTQSLAPVVAQTPAPTATTPPATTAPTEEPAPTFDDSVLGEAYTNEGTFTDAWGSEWSYSLHVPRLLLDTPAAEELNSKIHYDLFGFVTAMETAIAQRTLGVAAQCRERKRPDTGRGGF